MSSDSSVGMSEEEEAGTVHVAGIDWDACAYYIGRPGGQGRTHRQLMTDFFSGCFGWN